MKKLQWVVALALGLTVAGAGSAWAGDEGWAALGGFIGGAILSDVLGCNSYRTVHETRVIVQEPHYVREVVYGPPPRYVDKRVWHEGYWSHAYDRCGRRIKSWIPGYYSVVRVRVESGHHGGHYGGHSGGHYLGHSGGHHRAYPSHRSRSHCRW